MVITARTSDCLSVRFGTIIRLCRNRQVSTETHSSSRGVRQGKIVSPIIFNIAIDAVIRYWEARIGSTVGRRTVRTQLCDDGSLLSGEDPVDVQCTFKIIPDGFFRMGLKMTAAGTKDMIISRGKQTVKTLKRRATIGHTIRTVSSRALTSEDHVLTLWSTGDTAAHFETSKDGKMQERSIQ